MQSDKLLTITVKTFFGLEQVLMEELAELGYPKSTALNRAVQLEGTWKDVYYLNFHLRCAVSVLVQVESFRINHDSKSILFNSKMSLNLFI